MQRKNCVFSILFASALVFGACFGLSLKDKKAASLIVKADAEPNSSYVKIYDDNANYNNTAISSNYNQVLIVYSGVAHGLPSSGIYDSAVLGKISLNGTPLTSLPGSVVIPWEGQYWFRIAYPNTVVENDVLEVQSGITIGDAVIDGFKLRLNENQKWDYYFGDSVNATFKSIYNDDWNNTAQWDGWNRLLITYTGPAHNHPTAISGNELKKYNAYVFLDGQPFSSLGGSTQIAPWENQYWFNLIYPATAVYQGSVLEVREGTKIGDAVVEKMVFVLNSSSKWEKASLIEDDPLVKTNDYLLFTPSDVNLHLQNDSIPYYGDLGSVFLDSFAFQFNVNIPSADVSSTTADIKMGATNVYGSSPMFRLLLNETANNWGFGMFFNNTYDWNTYNKIPAWEGDVTHLVEFYAIKTDSTHMVFLLGVDGILIWKTAEKDISAVDFSGHTCLSFNNTGSVKDKSIYSDAPTLDKAINRFGINKLSAEDVPFSDHSDTGACLTKYAQAKAFYNTYLTSTQKVAFASDAAYANLRERFATWAEKNGETINFDITTGALTTSRISNVGLIFNKENSGVYFAIIVAAIATLSAVAAFLMLRKKKKIK